MTLIKQLEVKIEAWVCEQDWSNEGIIAGEMAITNSVFLDMPDITDIDIEKDGKTCYVFSCDFSLSGEPRKDDEPFCGDQIDVAVKGSISYQADELDEDSDDDDTDIENWIIDDDYTVSANVNDDWYGDSIDDIDYIDEAEERANNIICELSNMPSGLWFRGHTDEAWDLKPTIAREKNPSKELERILCLEFEKKTAFLYLEAHPLGTAKCNFLMRHHKIPTRILDWSRSPLVALYFAVSNQKEDAKDACIWKLNPGALNRFYRKKFPLELSLEDDLFKKISNEILAIHAPYTNQRMLHQQSEFTVHTNYEDMQGKLMPYLEKIIIPAKTKANLRNKLKVFKIDRGFLFPDLDNISAQIKEDILNDESEIF